MSHRTSSQIACFVALFSTSLFVTPVVSAQSPVVGDHDLPSIMEAATIPGLSLARIVDGQLAWTGAFGVADARTGMPVTDSTIFEAASLTKPVLAYVALRLASRGEFDIDVPLWNILEYERLAHDPRGQRLTARMVLSHVTGLPNWGGTPLQFVRDPGQGFGYSGEGFVYLQRVLEQHTGVPITDLVRREVFEPLGMRHSSLVWRDDYDRLSASPHDLIGTALDKRKPTQPNAASSLHTTASEYAQFVIAAMRGDGLSPAFYDDMRRRHAQVTAWNSSEIARGVFWGLGWGLQEMDGDRAWWHWGDNGQFRCFVYYDDADNGVVYFTNSENGLSIVDAVLGGERSDHRAARWMNYWAYDDPQRLARIALRRTALDGGADDALEHYQRLRRDNPDTVNEDELGDLTRFLAQNGRAQDARTIARARVSMKSSVDAWVSLAEAETTLGDYQDALESYREAMQLEPDRREELRTRVAWLETDLSARADSTPADPSSLSRYVGVYGEREIRLENGGLRYQRQGATAPTRLISLSPTLFVLESSKSFRIRFVLGQDGVPTKIVGQYSDGRTDESLRNPGDRIHESARHDFRVTTVVDGLEYPWSIAWLPSGEMLVTERPGLLRIVRDGVLDPEPLDGLPEVYRDRGQGGFMDVLPHPDFASNGLIYLSYGKPNADASQGTTTVVRGRLDGNNVVDLEEVFESDGWGDNNNHFSGRMVFDGNGYLYVAIGDRMASPDLLADHPAQDLTNHMGTIVRLHDDGRVPTDNPFVGRAGALPEIWSYGHRNMQGLAVDPLTGLVWSNEHGPRGGDELNLIERGGNYGWPVVSLGIHYDGSVFTTDTHREGMESPRFAWVPSIGPSGLMFYAGDQFPWWKGSAFVGGLAGQALARVTMQGMRAVSEERLLVGELGRFRDVRQGPDGLIYLAVEDSDGKPSAIVRLEPVVGEVALPR